MNVSELYALTHWIDAEITSKEIAKKYQQLHQLLQQNTQPNQQKQPFESQKEALIEGLRSVALDRLTKDQIALLESLEISQAVGEDGVATMEDILYRNMIDLATSAQKIQELIKNINNGVNKSNQIKAGLEGCVLEEEYETDGKVLMRVSFSGHAALRNITDFKSWANTWYDIGRGISMAHDTSPEDVKIIGATKGSIIIEMAVVYGIATTASGIILAALKVADRTMEIRKKAEEIRTLKLQNQNLAGDLEKEAESEKVKGIKTITGEIVKQLSIKRQGEGDKVNALDKAVRQLVHFIENGGEVDFVLPEEKEQEDKEGEVTPEQQQSRKLRAAFEEIRKLEKRIGLLEHKEPQQDP